MSSSSRRFSPDARRITSSCSTRYVDTTRHHVIIIDALADGHSSSPSNSAVGAVAFAGLTIGDMVEVQHRFLTEHLGLQHARAIVGISMGGFQVFEWAIRYPRSWMPPCRSSRRHDQPPMTN